MVIPGSDTFEKELRERLSRDQIVKARFYVCPYAKNCQTIIESTEQIDQCPGCGRNTEMMEAATREAAEKIQAQIIADVHWNPIYGKTIQPKIEQDPLQELLNQARSYYATRENGRGDQAAAFWLLKHRSIKTDITGRIYAYDPSLGYYSPEGELLLKADIIGAFGSIANRTRVGEILAKVQALSYCDEEILMRTAPSHLIPVENGVYDLSTKTLLPHSAEYFFTYKHPIVYDTTAECTLIHKFLSEIVTNDDDKQILLDIVALCLYRERVTPHFYVLVGGGRNGKSVFINVLRHMIGKRRVVSITPQSLAEDVFAPAQLYDKHANLGADIPGGVIKDIAIVKNATGGDAISVQRKGVDRDEREVYCEFVWACNDAPRITEDSNAIWNRLVVIHFPYTFVQEPKATNERRIIMDLEEQLITKEQLSGLFNEVITRLPRLLSRRRLSVTIDPMVTRKKYRSLSDTPAVFIDEECVEVDYEPSDSHQSASGYLTADEAYRAYKLWCRQNNAVPVSANRFGRAMETLGYERGKDNQQRSYRGLSFKQSSDEQRRIVTPTIAVVEEVAVEDCPVVMSPPIRKPQDILSFLAQQPSCAATFEQLLAAVPLDIPRREDWLLMNLRGHANARNVIELPVDTWRLLQ